MNCIRPAAGDVDSVWTYAAFCALCNVHCLVRARALIENNAVVLNLTGKRNYYLATIKMCRSLALLRALSWLLFLLCEYVLLIKRKRYLFLFYNFCLLQVCRQRICCYHKLLPTNTRPNSWQRGPHCFV